MFSTPGDGCKDYFLYMLILPGIFQDLHGLSNNFKG